MKLTDYLSTREGALIENRFSRVALIGLVICNLVLCFGLLLQRESVVLVPPTLEDRATVHVSAADREMQIAWGMYMSGLLGNVTPSSAQFLKANIGRHLTPRLYRPLVESIDAQVEQIKEEQVSMQFIPATARWEDKVDKVVVSGEFVVRGVRGAERRGLRTYELGFKTSNYRVMLDEIRVMDGPWSEAGGDQ